MNAKTAWKRFADLPPEAQQQVVDFIAFLQARYALPRPRKAVKQPDLRKEAFIGIWRDREDLRDSATWLRNVRQREWARRRE